jgi:hypothetical protein
MLLLVTLAQLMGHAAGEDNRRIVVYTVATERTEGYNRFLRSVELQELELVTLGRPTGSFIPNCIYVCHA